MRTSNEDVSGLRIRARSCLRRSYQLRVMLFHKKSIDENNAFKWYPVL
jgi:hypothetical protein